MEDERLYRGREAGSESAFALLRILLQLISRDEQRELPPSRSSPLWNVSRSAMTLPSANPEQQQESEEAASCGLKVGFERPRVLSWPIWIASLSIRSWVLIAFTTVAAAAAARTQEKGRADSRPWRDAAESRTLAGPWPACAWRRTPDCRSCEVGSLPSLAGVDGDDRSELHTEADRDLDRLPGDCDTGKAMLTISKVTGFQKANALVSEFPLTIADLIGVFDRLARRPLAVLLVAVDENDGRHSWRELHDGGIALAGLGSLNQLGNLGTVALGPAL
jgi:hypothetical protein